MKASKILLLAFLSLILSSPVLAQNTYTTPDWIRTISGFWFIFIGIGFFLIAGAYVIRGRYGRWLLGGGVLFLFISILLVIISVLLPLFGKPTVAYEQCVEMFKPDVSVLTVPGIFYTTSCILTGYAPIGLEWLTITTFVIFGIVLPLALLISLFSAFIPEGMIEHSGARRVIVVVASLFAFRGFFATFFVEMLSYGFAGLGALLVGVLFTGIVYKAAYKFVSPLGVEVSTELRYMALGEAEEIRREIGKLESAKSAATTEGKSTADIEARINRLTKRLKELEKKGK
jgi:hypothetical protein